MCRRLATMNSLMVIVWIGCLCYLCGRLTAVEAAADDEAAATSPPTVPSDHNCYPKKFASNSVVCVCNDTNCGTIGTLKPEHGRAVLYRSSMGGLRFDKITVDFDEDVEPTPSESQAAAASPAHLTITLSANETLQEIIGFGGAFTDSAGINWASLKSSALRDRLVEAYYGAEGLEYNIGRIPMGGCDFSTRDYTYDDVPGDLELKNFALASEDTEYKIPMISAANQVARERVFYFGSPWSAPAWMKRNNRTTGMGGLIGSPGEPYYKTWAQYFVKFYRAYKDRGVDLWGFTIQNEPTTGFLPWAWKTMAMSPFTQRDFLKKDLGPALFNATDDQIKIMVLDDCRLVLPWWANVIFRDSDANKFAAGVGVHWYLDNLRSANVLNEVVKAYPNKFILNTEACEGFQILANDVILGQWERAESYATYILDDLRHSVADWVDWNLCLDLQGGPNFEKNFVDSPIIVDKAKQSFYKQPMYYALGHFSKFVPRGSFRLGDTLQTTVRKLSAVGFLRPDGLKTVIFLNKANARRIALVRAGDGKQFRFTIPARSIVSAVW